MKWPQSWVFAWFEKDDYGNRYWSSSDPANMPCPSWTSGQQPSWHSTWPQYYMDWSGLLWDTGSSWLTEPRGFPWTLLTLHQWIGINFPALVHNGKNSLKVLCWSLTRESPWYSGWDPSTSSWLQTERVTSQNISGFIIPEQITHFPRCYRNRERSSLTV